MSARDQRPTAPCPYCERDHGAAVTLVVLCAADANVSDGFAAYLRRPAAGDAFLGTLLYGGAVGLHARGRAELGARLHALADEVCRPAGGDPARGPA